MGLGQESEGMACADSGGPLSVRELLPSTATAVATAVATDTSTDFDFFL